MLYMYIKMKGQKTLAEIDDEIQNEVVEFCEEQYDDSEDNENIERCVRDLKENHISMSEKECIAFINTQEDLYLQMRQYLINCRENPENETKYDNPENFRLECHGVQRVVDFYRRKVRGDIVKGVAEEVYRCHFVRRAR